MKFEVVIEAHVLNGVLRAVQAVSEDCILDISPDALVIRVVDASNAMAVSVNMTPDVFTLYDADEGRIAIDVVALYAKTNTYSADADVRLVWDDFQHNINISGDGAKWGVRSIDPTTVRKPPGMPTMELPLDSTIDSDRFKRMIKRAGMVSDHVSIGFGLAEDEEQEAFYISSLGKTESFREDVFGKDITYETTAVVESLYSGDMLAAIAKNFVGTVHVRLGRDLPVIFDYWLDSVPITFLLAPRMEKTE